MTEPLIDCHAHFLHAQCGRSDWQDVNAARFRAGEKMGITCHVASILGTYGFTSPTYFPSPADVTLGNDAMLALCNAEGNRVRMMVTVNPNHTDHALKEIERCVAAGAIGVKLLASRRADDPLLDPICALAAKHGLPVLHHIWQHRRREWPNQEISDGADLARLAVRRTFPKSEEHRTFQHEVLRVGRLVKAIKEPLDGVVDEQLVVVDAGLVLDVGELSAD